MTGEWLGERVREIRERVTPDDEASLWTLFFDDPVGKPVLAQAVDRGDNQLDADWLPNFARLLELVGAAACLLAIIRRDGRPRPQDQQLWRDLQVLVRGGRCRVLGFLVVGATTHWCAPGGETPAAA